MTCALPVKVSHLLYIREIHALHTVSYFFPPFAMLLKIENSATCEVQSVIQFLNAKNVCLAKIHRQNVEVHGEGSINKGNVRKAGCQRRQN